MIDKHNNYIMTYMICLHGHAGDTQARNQSKTWPKKDSI